MKMTIQQLQDLGYIETAPGHWHKGNELIVSQYPEDRSVITTKQPKRIRQSTTPLLNKLEQRYWGYLTMLYVGHPIISQGMKFRLANGCWYCPDFVVWGDENNATRAFEIKGKQPLQDDSVVKIKVAAKEYHWMRWYLVWWQDNQWKEQLVLP